eukprot:gene3775-549_t
MVEGEQVGEPLLVALRWRGDSAARRQQKHRHTGRRYGHCAPATDGGRSGE